MATLERAISTLSDAERRLRELLGQAAAEGDYEVVERLTHGARAIASLARTLQNGTLAHSEVASEAPSAASATAPSSRDKANTPALRPGQRRAVTSSRRVKRQPAKGEYPKFFRHGDILVKIGWSKKQREEYVHKAPRRVVDALAVAISKHAGNGKLFAAEELFSPEHPLKDPTTGEELPGYQGYVALAWFKASELVRPHGRRGYSARNQVALSGNLRSAWERLPVLQG